MKTIEIESYELNELSEDVRQSVLETYCEVNVHDTWYDPIYEGIRERTKEVGFEIKDIFFSGFWSQGDGAMFTYTGLDKKLLDKAVDSLSIPNWKKSILKNGYISGTGVHRGHYYHSNTCSHSIYVETDNGMQDYYNIEGLFSRYHEDIENYIIEIYQDLCQSLYTSLEQYYNELTSAEYVAETIIGNDYTFTKEGMRI